jgi:hypothetical protein
VRAVLRSVGKCEVIDWLQQHLLLLIPRDFCFALMVSVLHLCGDAVRHGQLEEFA